MRRARCWILLIAVLCLLSSAVRFHAEGVVVPASIQIVSAVYGKSDKTCDARAFLATRCTGRNRCEAMASNNLCGDPNPGLIKQLDVIYRCGPAEIKHASTMEYLLVELNCESASKLQTAESVIRVRHGQPTMATQPNCTEENLQEGADKNLNPHATCKRLCVDLPPRAKIRKVYGFAKESTAEDYLPCQVDSAGTFYADWNCNIESSAFYPQYQTTADLSGTKVCWTFRNWSLHQARDARLLVQYEK